MSVLIREEQQNQAFRTAYDFLKDNRFSLQYPAEYELLARKLAEAFAKNRDNPLACRLLSGVFDFICATSKRLEGEKNDS